MSALREWQEYTLLPTLFDHIDSAFPEMDFRLKGGMWRSRLHMDGSMSQKPDKTYISSKYHFQVRENGGGSMSIIDFAIARGYARDYISALQYLAGVCGLVLPRSDDFDRLRRQEEARQVDQQTFAAALWDGSEGAARVLDYMHARSWTDDEIRRARLGYVSAGMVRGLRDRTEAGRSAYDFRTDFGESIGTTHCLVIPFFNGSRLLGFKFRNIDYAGHGQKYLNSAGTTKSEGLFGMAYGHDEVVVVEGELDALRAQLRGASSTVATTGGAITVGQADDALRRGVKKFTLFFDADAAGQGFILQSANLLMSRGASVFVVHDFHGAKDTDEFLSTHTIDEWRAVVDAAIPVSFWRYLTTVERYKALASAAPDAMFKHREAFFRELETIINEPTTLPQDREGVFRLLETEAPDFTLGNVEGFREYCDGAYLRREAYERAAAVREASQQASSLALSGRTDDALRLMRTTGEQLSAKEKSVELANLFAPPSPADVHSMIGGIVRGIPTGFTFSSSADPHDKAVDELTLETGLTFICAYRAHGKTTFLNNIALNEARRNVALGNGQHVLYFSYEITRAKLIANLLNTFVADPGISKNPLRSIVSHFRGEGFSTFRANGQTPYAKRGPETTAQHFMSQKTLFLEKYIASGALTIVDRPFKVGELLDAIRFYVARHKVSLVCVDYAQLIESEKNIRLRTEEIKSVVTDIKNFANEAGLPFLMAAQFNREVDSPVSVDTRCIGEGGDFERIADTCIGMFNLKELRPLPTKREEERDALRLLNALKVTPQQLTDLHPIPGKIFLRLLKRRDGNAPLDIVVDWDGATKLITPNYPEALAVDLSPAQGSLFDGDSVCPF